MTIPINPNVTDSAKHLLNYLSQVPDSYILTGQHSYPATFSYYYDRAYALTGRYPAVWGQDFGFAGEDDKDSIYARDKMIEDAIHQHQQGAIITLMWHAVRPTDDEPGQFKGNVIAKLPDNTYDALVTPGSVIYQRWVEQVDVIAGYLKRLRDADVPVLWRPYHEMNGNWFWWGNQPGSRFIDLWKQMYHHFTDKHELHNLLWVWNANMPVAEDTAAYAVHFPGIDYADILATDIYNNNYQDSAYEKLLELAQGKPIAIGECGEMPMPDVFYRQSKWTWFMTWSELLESKNTSHRITAVHQDKRIIYRDHPKLSWKAWQHSNP